MGYSTQAGESRSDLDDCRRPPPALTTRYVVGLLYPRHLYALSDEEVKVFSRATWHRHGVRFRYIPDIPHHNG